MSEIQRGPVRFIAYRRPLHENGLTRMVTMSYMLAISTAYMWIVRRQLLMVIISNQFMNKDMNKCFS